MLPLQALEELLGGHVRFVLEPSQGLGPDLLERIHSGPVPARILWLLTVRRTGLTVFPQSRESGEEGVEAL